MYYDPEKDPDLLPTLTKPEKGTGLSVCPAYRNRLLNRLPGVLHAFQTGHSAGEAQVCLRNVGPFISRSIS